MESDSQTQTLTSSPNKSETASQRAKRWGWKKERELVPLDQITGKLDAATEAHLQRVAAALKERYSHMPFYAKQAAGNPTFWRSMAASAWNAL